MRTRALMLGLAAFAAVVLTAPADAAAITFGHAVVVDHQRVAGEPSLSISPTVNPSGHHDIYVSAPYGFSTTASFVWKSQDGGQTFHLVGDEAPPTGKPAMSCAGGGDSSIVNDPAGNLYFSDLQGLTDVSNSVSTDGGNTFASTCNAANDVGVDRPWLAAFGNPLTTGRLYMTVDEVDQCVINCGLGEAGNNQLELTQTSGAQAAAQVFAPLPGQQIEPDGIVGGAVVDQRNGDLYIVHTALTDNSGRLVGGGDSNGNPNAIVVDRFPGGYAQTTATPIPPGSISLCSPYNFGGSAPCQSETAFFAPLNADGSSPVTTGQDFSPITIDSSGNLYLVWSQAPVDSSGQIDGPSTIFLATSSDQGKTWTPPINVSSHIPNLKTNLFPWVAAGSRGRADIVWYGTPTLGSCPNQPCGSSSISGVWNVYMAQTLNAVKSTGSANPAPTFTTTKVSEYSPHFGAICTMGIGCTTGGDRGLLDFLQVQADPSGAADVVWSDGANNDFNGGETSAVIDYAQQVGGPGLFGGTISGAAPLSGAAPGSPDSYFAGGGAQVPAPSNSNMNIVRSSVVPGTSSYTVTMKVASLASLAPDPALGGQDLIWLTRWELPNSHPTQQVQGHWFYAAMESDNGGPPTFYAGQSTCGITTTHCKFINYPSTHTVTGTFTPAGEIRITVPASDVGSRPTAKLFSVTGVTATQTQSASSGTAIFNVIDSTPPYDVTAP